MSTIVLITGANRGLGKGLLERYLNLPNHTVIAANRNPDHPTSKALSDLPKAEGTKLVVVKVDATVWQDAFDAVKKLEGRGIDHLDVVIANAGVANAYPLVADVKPVDLDEHIRPNVYGPVSLYQATRPLLRRSKKEPIFEIMGGLAGSLNSQPPIPDGLYGPSKAAASWLTIRINAEDDWLNSFAINPGLVNTQLGETGVACLSGVWPVMASRLIGLDESCDGMMKVLASTSKEKHGGKLVRYTGETVEW